MRMLVSGQFIASMALAYCLAQPVAAQNTSSASAEVEQHIQRVTSGLTGDEHGSHTLADRMNELKIPGVSIAVIHQGKIEWARGFGVRSVGGSPVTADTMFQAGSISKPLAAMAALRLVQQGKLSLDTNVNTYLTSWKLPGDPVTAGKPITLRELLTHTAGTTVHGFPGYASRGAGPDPGASAQRRKAREHTTNPQRGGAWGSLEILGRRIHHDAASPHRRNPGAISRATARFGARADRDESQHL